MHTIRNLFAFAARNKEGDGVICANLPLVGLTPLICSDPERLSAFFDIAEAWKRQTKQEYVILRFGGRADVTALVQRGGPSSGMEDVPPFPQPSDHDLEFTGQIIEGEGDHFSAQLMRLIKRSDISNRERLRSVYPVHVEAVEQWEHSASSPPPLPRPRTEEEATPFDEPVVDLGPCCVCGQPGPSVRNIISLHKKAPTPGQGWGCIACDLPSDGAIAVVCDACHEARLPLKQACQGFPASGGRVPIESLSGEHDHDLSRHPEVSETRAPHAGRQL